MVRDSLAELTSEVVVGGRPATITVYFAVGRPKQKSLRKKITRESEKHGDIAILDIRDGESPSDKTDKNAKSWYQFVWAAQQHPDAHMVFKQDDDTVIDWRVALPRILGHLVKGRKRFKLKKLQRTYAGRLCPRNLCLYPEPTSESLCGAGELYGFSIDLVRWIVENTRPEPGYEDMVSCSWMRRFEKLVGPVDTRGLLYGPAHENAWIHPVKSEDLYKECVGNRINGCAIGKRPTMLASGEIIWEPEQYFKLPERRFAKDPKIERANKINATFRCVEGAITMGTEKY